MSKYKRLLKSFNATPAPFDKGGQACHYKNNTSPDILQIYIDKGYGDTKASDFFRYDTDSYCFTWLTKPYAILLANFPFANTISELKKYLEFTINSYGKRRWTIKPPLKSILRGQIDEFML